MTLIKEYLKGFKAVNPYSTIEQLTVKELDLPKGAKSVSDPSEVPKGWRVVKGPRGGTYAVPGPNAKSKQPDKDKKKPNKGDKKEKSKKQINDLDKELDEINKIFDKIHEKKQKLKDADEYDELQKMIIKDEFRQARMKHLYPFNKKLLNMNIDLGEIEFGKGSTPIVRMAQEGDRGHIEHITPDKYLDMVNAKSEIAKLNMMEPWKVIRILKGLAEGNEFQPGFLEYSDGEIQGHEGRHRAIVAKILGLEKIPVAIVGKQHEEFDIEKAKPQDLYYGAVLK